MRRSLTKYTGMAGMKAPDRAVLRSALGKARVAVLTGRSACVSVFVQQTRSPFCCAYSLTQV